jgi:hypothetical protein
MRTLKMDGMESVDGFDRSGSRSVHQIAVHSPK